MRRPLRAVLRAAPLLAALLLAPSPARAAPAGSGVEVGLGADLFPSPRTGAFELTLGGRAALARHLSLGGRVGVLVFSGSGGLGVPLDVALRAHFNRIYLEGLLGPWIHDGGLDLHGAIGFGLVTASLRFGLEVGWLDGRSMVGLRLAIPI